MSRLYHLILSEYYDCLVCFLWCFSLRLWLIFARTIVICQDFGYAARRIGFCVPVSCTGCRCTTISCLFICLDMVRFHVWIPVILSCDKSVAVVDPLGFR